MNRHGDHVASCLCCTHFVLDMGHGDWSEVTPGDPAEVSCRKGHFCWNEDRTQEHEIHGLMELGRECPDFKERDES